MDTLKKQIIEFAKQDDVDLIGFAKKSRFDEIDPQHNPFSIFPEGKTVIMLGKRICRGSLRGIEEGTNFGDYQLFGKNWLEDEFLALSAYNITNFIESNGWEAVPVFPNPSDLEAEAEIVFNQLMSDNCQNTFDFTANYRDIIVRFEKKALADMQTKSIPDCSKVFMRAATYMESLLNSNLRNHK